MCYEVPIVSTDYEEATVLHSELKFYGLVQFHGAAIEVWFGYQREIILKMVSRKRYGQLIGFDITPGCEAMQITVCCFFFLFELTTQCTHKQSFG